MVLQKLMIDILYSHYAGVLHNPAKNGARPGDPSVSAPAGNERQASVMTNRGSGKFLLFPKLRIAN